MPTRDQNKNPYDWLLRMAESQNDIKAKIDRTKRLLADEAMDSITKNRLAVLLKDLEMQIATKK